MQIRSDFRQLLKETVSQWMDINAPRLGAALAFYTMLSIAPLLVVCVAIAGLFFRQEAIQGQIVYQIQGIVGPQGGKLLQSILENASSISGSTTAAVLGFLMLLFGASGVFGELHDSLNLVWGVKANSGSGLKAIIRYRFFSFAMVLGIGFLLMVSLVLSALIAAAGKFFAAYLPTSEGMLHLESNLLSFITVTVLFALLYKVVPDARIEWQDVWIGAGVTSLLFSIGKFLIGLYIGKASVGSAFGAAGSLVVFLVWVYYSAQIFFLGAEFTHTFSERHGSRAQARQQRVERKMEEKGLKQPSVA